MLLSRFWYIVLAAIAGISIAGASIVRSTYERDRARDSDLLLRSDRQQIENLLRTDARVRLDNLVPVAANPELTRWMAQAKERTNDGPALQDLSRRISSQLRILNEQLGEAARGQMLIAVDTRGIVVGRTGYNENSSIGEYIGGHPLIARALDGYVRDDTWEIQGRVFRMAARPVIERGRYVGAVIHAREIDNAFVQRISEALGGASVAFFTSNGMIYAAHQGESDRGRPAPSVAALSEQIRTLSRNPQWLSRGYTDVLEVQNGTAVAIYGTIAGTVGLAGGGFAVGRPRPVLPADYLLHAPADEIRRVPWKAIIAFMVGASVLGLLFVFFEHDRGDRQLRAMLQQLAERKIDRLDPLALRGGARRLALAINEAFEQAMREELARAGTSPRRSVDDLDALLGPPVAQPQTPPFADVPPSPAAVPGTPPPVRTASPGAPPPPPSPSRPGAPPPPPPPRTAPTPASPTTGTNSPDTSGPVATVTEQTMGFASPAEEQAHWREIFEQFVATKKQCGEPTDALSFEKFSATLQRHKDQLQQRTQCKAVRFQVYVKDGKATLKAIPVK